MTFEAEGDWKAACQGGNSMSTASTFRHSLSPVGRVVAVALSALLISGCDSTADPAQRVERQREREKSADYDSVTVRGQVQGKAFPGPVPPDANIKGAWSSVVDWPLIAVHAVLLPDGRVLSYGTDGEGTQTGYFIYDVWTPSLGFGPESHLTLPNTTQTDLFCGTQVVLPQAGAGVFLAGGDNWTGSGTTNSGNDNTNVFSYEANTLTRGSNLNRERWYASTTVLLNGETYLQGGMGGTDRPEIRATDGTFRLLSGANTDNFNFWYPRNFIAPDGRVFGYDSFGQMYYINTEGAGSVATVGQFSGAYASEDASAAMFRPGRILQFGGNSNGAIVIDITGGGTPVVTPTQSMSSQRRLVSATILPNGDVLATGGSREWNQLVDVNTIAEIWNPATGSWTQGASGSLPRLYHSNALLLPDATVLVAGGGAPGPLNNLNAEIYYPPYLFSSGGNLAPRPRIAAAPATLVVGQSFPLEYADTASVSRVVLVKNGSATHNWNMDQRFTELTFSAAGSQLTVQMSSQAANTPPGYYMLFVLDAAGVPSEARIVWINVAGAPVSQNAPVLIDPVDQTGTVDIEVSLAVQASDVENDALTFSGSGLPPGVAINSTTGVINGTPTTSGIYDAVVSVSDGVASDSANFTWTIFSNGPLEISPLPPPVPAQSNVDINFSATASRADAQFKWNFGDGTPETAYSTSGNTTHRFSAPGIYFVTVTATDAAGTEVRQTFMQLVHLPLTAKRPTASSNIVYEARPGVSPRVWMVNQDNDSVSVFEAVDGTKIAEIAVRAAPRSLAIDALGRIWVVNKRGPSVSVIDPNSFGIIRTIAMPRASLPFGIVMSPAGDFAYITLEATGQVLKYRTSNYGKLLTASVGPNPRHVSVSADGATVYVTRFVTPPQPGESTATVQTTGGGEIVKLSAATLSVTGTVVLGFSTAPDAENRGRGLPNYLGAAVISPDGSQAWVPSKQDNVQRGQLRDGLDLNFQHTVRAISSRIDLSTGAEDLAARIDHDNSSIASAAAFDPLGILLFVALETSREVAVVNAHDGSELFRFEVGLAPQGVAVSGDGATVYVNNFMQRTLGVYDLRPFLDQGQLRAQEMATIPAVNTEKLTSTVLLGKQLFYDARDPRLALDRYMSCASCHNDGDQDGRVWDLTGFGEGLRNTVALRGRAGGQGFLHWSNNFDEVQDFEGQIRSLAGGTGLMNDAAFFAGSRAQPLGTPKAGVSADLDALAAYLSSLNTFEYTPFRTSNTALTAQGTAGKAVFASKGCGTCHAGIPYTGSGSNTLVSIGTVKPESGMRLGEPLTGMDVPTLRDVWFTAPYLHDGSAATLDDAIRAHQSVSISEAEMANLSVYVKSIGREEAAPAVPLASGIGLRGEYFNNKTLTGPVVLTRNETVDFSWSASPGTGVNANSFSVRWTGSVLAPVTGSYRFQTQSNDGVRLWVNGTLLVDNWVAHATATDTSPQVNLVAGQSYVVVMEFYDNTSTAVARFRWQTPTTAAYVKVPLDRLFPPP